MMELADCDKLMDEFRELASVDNSMCVTLQSLVTGIRKLSNKIPDNAFIISGSVEEGATLARWFSTIPEASPWEEQEQVLYRRSEDVADETIVKEPESANTHAQQLVKEIELDMMLVAGRLPKDCAGCVEPIDGQLGHVALKKSDSVMMHVNDELKDRPWDGVVSDGYLNSYQMKWMVQRKAYFSDKDQLINLVIGIVMGVDPDKVIVSPPREVLTKASQQIEVWVRVETRDLFKYSSDNVPSIRAIWWPKEAEEWAQRSSRLWPPSNVIELIMQEGFHIVPKPSPNDSESKFSKEMRYSFSLAEITLSKQRTKQQTLVYLIFKSLFYHCLKPLAPNDLSSYYGKTTMMWICEEYPPDHSIWGESTSATLSALDKLLGYLQHHLVNGNLEHYFIRDINLIAGIPEDIRKMAAEYIRRLRLNPSVYFPTNISEVITESSKLVKLINGASEIIQMIVAGRYFELALDPRVTPHLPKILEYIQHEERKKRENIIKDSAPQTTARPPVDDDLD